MKRTLMVLALMAIMFGMAAATETRVATFGPASMFINDYTDIYFLPANAVYYPRLDRRRNGRQLSGRQRFRLVRRFGRHAVLQRRADLWRGGFRHQS